MSYSLCSVSFLPQNQLQPAFIKLSWHTVATISIISYPPMCSCAHVAPVCDSARPKAGADPGPAREATASRKAEGLFTNRRGGHGGAFPQSHFCLSKEKPLYIILYNLILHYIIYHLDKCSKFTPKNPFH